MPRTKKTETNNQKKKETVKTVGKKKTQKFSLKKYFSGIKNNLQKNKKLYLRYGAIIVVVILIGAFAFLKKNWFVAAIVNGQPITTVEFYQNLKDQNGKEVLEQIIRNKVIMQEANKKGINVDNSEINKKLAEIEKQVGGKDQLKAALEARNITDKAFKDQIKIQIIVEKLLSKDTAVSDKEIDDYITNNPSDPNVALEKGPDREEIKKQLSSQKLNDKFETWYLKLEKNSNIVKF